MGSIFNLKPPARGACEILESLIGNPMLIRLEDFRKRIEFSLCQQFASEEDVKAFVAKAISTRVGVVCVNPVHVALTARLLEGNNMDISGNVGFPF